MRSLKRVGKNVMKKNKKIALKSSQLQLIFLQVKKIAKGLVNI